MIKIPRKIFWPVVIVTLLLIGYGIFHDRDTTSNKNSNPSSNIPKNVNYIAKTQTTDVPEMIKDIKENIRSVQGTIDNEYVSEKSSHVGFVMAKEKLDGFRNALEKLTNRKLTTETVSSQSAISQKPVAVQQSATTTLAALEKRKKDLDTRHALTISSSTKKQATTSIAQANENKLYESQTKALDSQIAQIKATIAQNKTQVTPASINSETNTETVSGYIDITWISVWDLITLYVPAYLITLLIIVIVLVVAFFLYRKGYFPKIRIV